MSVAAAHEPRVNYMLTCMGCHLADGSGATGKVPSMRDTLVAFAQLGEGRRYLIQVPGTAQSSLSNAEVAALLNWMMRNLSASPRPPGVADFTAAEVASYRSKRLTDAPGMRARVLATLALQR